VRISTRDNLFEIKSENMTQLHINSPATDSRQNRIKKNDAVRVVYGLHAGCEGKIKHLYKSFAFLHSPRFANNRIFVSKIRG